MVSESQRGQNPYFVRWISDGDIKGGKKIMYDMQYIVEKHNFSGTPFTFPIYD